MIITVDNGWKGPIVGLASIAAVSRSGERATIIVPRAALIERPRPGERLRIEDGDWTVTQLRAERHDIIIYCDRS